MTKTIKIILYFAGFGSYFQWLPINSITILLVIIVVFSKVNKLCQSWDQN